MLPLSVRPEPASFSRASYSLSSGTVIAPVAWSSLNGICAVRSRSVASAVPFSSRPVYRGV
ncbi:hypothetical protein NB689_003134 [Xanthomonas sacchari]|nr:hypothetical protein [Xanthomonas sacchari]